MNTESESASYQKMLTQVEKIVDEVSDPDLDLDLLVTKVEKGYELIEAMRSRLNEAKGKIESLREKYTQ